MNLIENVAHASVNAGAGSGAGSGWLTILFLGGMVALFYFMLIRPQQKQRKAHQALVGALSRGDEVVLTSGMWGIVMRVEEDHVVVKVSKDVELKFQKQAVSASLPKGTIEL